MMLPTKILPHNLLNTIKRTRPLYYVGRKARFVVGSGLGSRHVAGLEGRAHYNDFMLNSVDPSSVDRYRNGAQEFVGILGQALAEADRSWTEVTACLEVGCGYGRIVRELRRELPVSAISICDINEEAARFTAAEFGVRKAPTVEKMDAAFDESFDLVFLLSVYTHLRLDLIEANLARVAAVTKPGGVVVLTVHGEGSAEIAEIYDQYWLDKATLRAGLDRDGYYYERYPYYYSDYGMTWFKDDCLRATVRRAAPSLEFVAWRPVGLERHQDVYVYRKV